MGFETRKDRYRVFQVVDMSDVEVSVDVVSKVLVSNLSTNVSAKDDLNVERWTYPREAIQHRLESDVRQMKWQVHRVNQSDCST